MKKLPSLILVFVLLTAFTGCHRGAVEQEVLLGQPLFDSLRALQARFSFVYYTHLIHRFPREDGYEGTGLSFINICCPAWPRSTIPFRF